MPGNFLNCIYFLKDIYNYFSFESCTVSFFYNKLG